MEGLILIMLGVTLICCIGIFVTKVLNEFFDGYSEVMFYPFAVFFTGATLSSICIVVLMAIELIMQGVALWG